MELPETHQFRIAPRARHPKPAVHSACARLTEPPLRPWMAFLLAVEGGGRGLSDAREAESAAAHPLVCWEKCIYVHQFRWYAAERSHDILHAILWGQAHYQTSVPHDMNDGVTTYRPGERDLGILHSDVGEQSQKRRRTH